MTSLAVILLGMIPATLGLFLFALGNPKRRRIRGETPASPQLKSVALVLCLLSGLFVAATGGVAMLLIWIGASAFTGWGVANGLTIAPAWTMAFGDGAIKRAIYLVQRETLRVPQIFRHYAPSGSVTVLYLWSQTIWLQRIIGARPIGTALRARSHELVVAGGVICALLITFAALGVWRATTDLATAAMHIEILQAIRGLKEDQVNREAIRSCLEALNKSQNADVVLSNLLTGHSFTLSLTRNDAAEEAGTNLQRCILANGGDSVTVNEDKTRSFMLFVVDQMAAQSVAASLVEELDHNEVIAMSINKIGTTGIICQSLLSIMDPRIHRLFELQNAKGAASKELLAQKFPFLTKLITQSPGSPCLD